VIEVLFNLQEKKPTWWERAKKRSEMSKGVSKRFIII